jgi:hypothetical protein
VPLAFWLLRRSLSSASPDAPLALLSWIVLLLLAEKLESGSGARLDATALVITALAAFGAVTKLSAAPLLLAPAWLIGRNVRTDGRRAAAFVGLALTAVAPFLIRNVVLSGYVLFPVSWTQVPGLRWTVPRERVDAHLARIGDWARSPSGSPVPALDFAGWFPAWCDRLTRVEQGILAALALLVLGHVGHMGLALWRRRAPAWPPGSGLLAGLTLAGTVLWLSTAPDPRFGWGFFPFLTLLLAALPVHGVIRRLPRTAGVLLLALLLLDQGRRVIAQHGEELAGAWLWPAPPPAVATRSVPIGAGVSLRVPVHGEQCWDEPLPCAPALDSALTLRGSRLEQGFQRNAKISLVPSE